MGLRWVHGDGGPTIVLQQNATALWRGAGGFDNSLMAGGNVEIDYDIICKCSDWVTVIQRHGRDMLVLQDCEQPACFAPWKAEHVMIVQGYVGDHDVERLVERVAESSPVASFDFDMVDSVLRLLVGADDGEGGMYGFAEVACAAGRKTGDVYHFDDVDVLIATLSPIAHDRD